MTASIVSNGRFLARQQAGAGTMYNPLSLNLQSTKRFIGDEVLAFSQQVHNE